MIEAIVGFVLGALALLGGWGALRSRRQEAPRREPGEPTAESIRDRRRLRLVQQRVARERAKREDERAAGEVPSRAEIEETLRRWEGRE